MEESTKQVCYQLMDVLFVMKHDLSRFAEEQGLTFMQLYALMEIHRKTSISMSSVAKQLQCDASNVTGIIDRLVRRGLIDRVEDEHDRRAKLLRLTAEGEQLAVQCLTLLPARLTDKKLNEHELLTLTNALEKIVHTS